MISIKRKGNRNSSENSSTSFPHGLESPLRSDHSDSFSVESSMSCSSQVYRQGHGVGRFRFSKKGNIFKMIEEEQWVEVRKILKSSRGGKICMKTDTSGLSVLGLALGFHAPLDIVARILILNPKSSMERDMFDAVPLHVACLNGVSFNVVKHLMNHDDNIATILGDNDNRLPLHHAVEYAIGAKDDEDNEDVDLEVIQLLCSVAPKTVRMSDINGESPIDLVQMVKAEAVNEDNPNYKRAHKVYHVMKEANIRLYRLEKRRAEGYVESEKMDKSIGTSVTDDITSAVSSMNISNQSDIRSNSQSVESSSKKSNNTRHGNFLLPKSRRKLSQKSSSSDDTTTQKNGGRKFLKRLTKHKRWLST